MEFNNEQEVWKDVENYQYYSVSTLGNVVNNQYLWRPNGHHYYFGKPVAKCSSKGRKYLRVGMSNAEGRKLHLVHRLVAKAFIPNPENKPQVNHKDGDPSNNKLSNLEWATASENTCHARDTGLVSYARGEARPESKRTVGEIKEIYKRFFFDFESVKELNEDFKMHPKYIPLILRGVRWSKEYAEFYTQHVEYLAEVKPLIKNRRFANMSKTNEELLQCRQRHYPLYSGK